MKAIVFDETVKWDKVIGFSEIIKGRYYNFTLTYLHEVETIYIFGSDITDRKKAEDSLRVEKEKAEDATKLKDKFVSLVAHDLRSPFSSILGYLTLLEKDKINPLSENQQMLLKRAKDGGLKLLEMIEQLLNISMPRTGKIVPQKKFIDLYFVALSTISKLEFLAKEKGISLENQIPRGVRVYSDLNLFAEVIMNLVSNSIKFTKRGDKITIFLPDGNVQSVAVKDTGVGIEKKLLKDLFKSEIKTSTKGTDGEKGTGLGLPFCHDIMEAHGGTLKVESELGKGTVFTAILPFVQPVVLVADDDEGSRYFITENLHLAGIKTVEVEVGKQALESIKQNRPHLIISDIDMPGLSGFELLDVLKKDESLAEIPVMIITSSQSMDTKDKVFNMGAADFVNKPIKPEELMPRIRRLLT